MTQCTSGRQVALREQERKKERNEVYKIALADTGQIGKETKQYKFDIVYWCEQEIRHFAVHLVCATFKQKS
jgi:hypothetical protein